MERSRAASLVSSSANNNSPATEAEDRARGRAAPRAGDTLVSSLGDEPWELDAPSATRFVLSTIERFNRLRAMNKETPSIPEEESQLQLRQIRFRA